MRYMWMIWSSPSVAEGRTIDGHQERDQSFLPAMNDAPLCCDELQAKLDVIPETMFVKAATFCRTALVLVDGGVFGFSKLLLL